MSKIKPQNHGFHPLCGCYCASKKTHTQNTHKYTQTVYIQIVVYGHKIISDFNFFFINLCFIFLAFQIFNVET